MPVIPAAQSVPIRLVWVPDSAVAIAETIGARLRADDPIALPVPRRGADLVALYSALDAAAVRLPGDVLVTGLDESTGSDRDVPTEVTDLAARGLRL